MGAMLLAIALNCRVEEYFPSVLAAIRELQIAVYSKPANLKNFLCNTGCIKKKFTFGNSR